MNPKRFARLEMLESRRLLAAEWNFDGFDLLERMHWESADFDRVGALFSESGRLDEVKHEWRRLGFAAPLLYPGLSRGPDLVQEVGDRLFVVDQDFNFDRNGIDGPGGALLVFGRGGEGELELLQEFKLEVHVDRMIVRDRQVVLIGAEFDVRIMLPTGPATPQELAVAPRLEDGRMNRAGGAVNGSGWASVQDWMPTPPTARTIALTVDLEGEGEIVEQTLPPLSHTIHQDGDQLVVIASPRHPFYSPIPRYERLDESPDFAELVTTYQITPDGLVETATFEIPTWGSSVVRGKDLFVASTQRSADGTPANEFIDWTFDFGDEDRSAEDGQEKFIGEMVPPIVSVARYPLTDTKVSEVTSIELGAGHLLHFEVAGDGSTGVAVYQNDLDDKATTTIALLSMSVDQIEVVESVTLNRSDAQVLLGGPDYVVLKHWRDQTLTVINVNQDVDLQAENRVRELNLPDGVELDYGALHFGDRLVLRGQRATVVEGLKQDRPLSSQAAESKQKATPSRAVERLKMGPLTLTPDGESPSVFLLISLSEGRVIAESELPEGLRAVSYEHLVLIDSESQRFGFVAKQSRSDTEFPSDRERPFGQTQWVFGQFSEAGDFRLEGAIPLQAWLEIDVDPERLLVRLADRLEQYDWSPSGEPVVVPLPRIEPPLEAVNDQFRRRDRGRDQFLNVLANDVISRHATLPAANIVELKGAPDGAEVIRGRFIRIPAAAFRGVESFEFEYVISDGNRDSRAVVEVRVVGPRETPFEALVNAVTQQASEDYQVALEEVKVHSVEKLLDYQLPIALPVGPIDLDWVPGVLAVVQVGQARSLYAADWDQNVTRVVEWDQDHLAELSVSPVDFRGKPLKEVREGDEFFLQLKAKDLRDSPLGLATALIDLDVSTEHFVMTGPVEFEPGFEDGKEDAVEEGAIDLQAVQASGEAAAETLAQASGWQEILRVGVRAVAAGEVKLFPKLSEESGAGTVLHGIEQVLPDNLIRILETEIEILPAVIDRPHDTNGDGVLTSRDALVVINFLGSFGTLALSDLPAKLGLDAADARNQNHVGFNAMKRYDTNGDGTISAQDVLRVINRLMRPQSTVEAEEDGDELTEAGVAMDVVTPKVDKI